MTVFQVRPEIEEQLGTQFSMFKLLSYKTMVTAGVTYFMKVENFCVI